MKRAPALTLSVLGSLFLMMCGGCSEKEDSKISSAADSPGFNIVKKNCRVCHAQGINGAPIIGNTKMWKGRATKSIEELVSHAMNGFGLMPAKGGNAELTEQEITLAVKYMLSQVNE